MSQEVELKLELSPEGAESLMRAGLPGGEPAVSQLRSVYFDTPARALHEAGLSLRIRHSASGRIQTVKAAGEGSAGLFVRPEWEKPVDGDTPVLDDSTPVRALLGARAADVRPAFEVRVERRTWIVEHEGSTIELVLDRGEVCAGERRTPICEMELELKRGKPSALFSLARELSTAVAMRPGVLNKAERGYRLLGPASRALKAEPLALSRGMTTAAAFREVAAACLRHFRLNEALLDPSNDEAVHQMRVALRRLRSALTIWKPMLEGELFEHLRSEMRWLASTLGEARDLDVLLAQDGAQALRETLQDARRQAYGEVEAALASARTRALMLDLLQWLAEGDWLGRPETAEMREQPAKEFAAAALERFRRKVKKGGRDLASLDDEARHEVRKDAKKLRYAADFFAGLFGDKRQKRRHRQFVETLATLQDALGEANDLAVRGELLARLGLSDHPGAASLGGAGDRQLAVDAAAEAHELFSDARRFWR